MGDCISRMVFSKCGPFSGGNTSCLTLRGVWVVFDRCASHLDKRYKVLRAAWAKECNVVLLGDSDGREAPPGGWSADGQPNDGLHNVFHRLSDAWHKCLLNWHSNVLLRKQLEDLEFSSSGFGVQK